MNIDRNINKSTWQASYRAFRQYPALASYEIVLKVPFIDVDCIDVANHLSFKADWLAYRPARRYPGFTNKSFIQADKKFSVGVWSRSNG